MFLKCSRGEKMKKISDVIATRLIILSLVFTLFAGFLMADEDYLTRRDRQTQPLMVMDVVGVKPGMIIGEAGAGRGFLTLWLAKRVGENGRIIANDISASALEVLKNKAEEEGLTNIETVIGGEVDPKFTAKGLDMVFFCYAIHDFTKPVEFLRVLKGYITPETRVVVLDQDPAKTGSSHFFKKSKLIDVFTEAGYELIQEEDFLSKELICVFKLK